MKSEIKFVIIANPRTGSNNFIELLNSHSDITCHREVFHKNSVYLLEGTRDDLIDERQRDPIGFLSRVYGNCLTKACGFKIFMDHNNQVFNCLLNDIDVKKIILYRPNYLAVYSSDLIATKEKHYLIVKKKPSYLEKIKNYFIQSEKKILFDRSVFENRWNDYVAYYQRVVEALNETNQEYLFVTYEDYLNETLFRRVFPFLGLEQPEKVQTRLIKMNSSNILSRFENSEYVRDYLEEIGRLDWVYEGFMTW